MNKHATWPVAEAKAKLSEVIERARHEGPQTITRKGKRAVVVVSAEEWDGRKGDPGKTPVDMLLELLKIARLEEGELDLRRVRDGPRPVEFE